MLNPQQIDELYKEYMQNLSEWAHDGVVNVNLPLLYDLGLVQHLNEDSSETDDLAQYFHVIESPEKVTLFNEHFIIWIVPKMEGESPVTYVIIALNAENKTHLEVVFTTSGVYNTPKFVLKVLQYFLLDMLETEETLTLFEKKE